MNTTPRPQLLTASPTFHFWNGLPQTGGFDALLLPRLSGWLGELPS